MNVDTFEIESQGRTLTVRLEHDPDCSSPLECEEDEGLKIAYLHGSRYALGSVGLTEEEMREVEDGIHTGRLFGVPVYALVHSGIALSTLPFGDKFDSGRSGFVYCDAKWAERELGNPGLALKTTVAEFGAWLNGETFQYVVEDENGDELDSCCGLIGYDYARKTATTAAEQCVSGQAAA